MNKVYSSLVLLTIAATLASCGSSSQPTSNLPAQRELQNTESFNYQDETPKRWYVEFKATKNQGISAQSIEAQAREMGIQYTVNYRYNSLFNGMSVTATAGDIEAIASLPGVKAVYPVKIYGFPKLAPNSQIMPQMASAITQTGVADAHAAGITGKGVRVGIIDSGVDVDHPDFKGRIVAQKDLVGDTYDAVTNPVARPDNNADDCGGHGTHVAGIVAANGKVKGVAPDASIGAYRVFGCDGSTQDDVLLAALEQAIADKMDVVNMSLGSFGYWRDMNDPYAIALKKAVQNGLIVVVSAGNEGDEGPFASGSLSAMKETISVANFENKMISNPTILVDGKEIRLFEGNDVIIPGSGTLPIARTGTVTTTNDACEALPANSLKDKVALIRRGTCTFEIKMNNAVAAGAKAVIIYNRDDSPIFAPYFGPNPKVPGGMISAADGAAINALLDAGKTPTVTWQANWKLFPNPRAGLVAESSSYGPNALLDFRPDLGAPGNFIYSTYPMEKGGYANLSGTSMASPHVAGAVALLLEKHPLLKGRPEDVRVVLQNGADPAAHPFEDKLDAVNRQGAGMLNIMTSINTYKEVVVEPGNINLGEAIGATVSSMRIDNKTNKTVIYALSHAPAVGTYGTKIEQESINEATISFSGPAVVEDEGVQYAVVSANSSATVSMQITPDEDENNGTLFGGYVIMTPVSEHTKATLTVPYMGYKGDFQAEPAMTENRFGWFDPADKAFKPQLEGAVFDLSKGQFPTVAYHFENHAERLIVDVLNANNNQPVYATGSAVLDYRQVVRNTTASYFRTFTWKGGLKSAQLEAGVPVTKTVADGAYRLRFRALRIAGDENNTNHWDVWTSPVFYIKNGQ